MNREHLLKYIPGYVTLSASFSFVVFLRFLYMGSDMWGMHMSIVNKKNCVFVSCELNFGPIVNELSLKSIINI